MSKSLTGEQRAWQLRILFSTYLGYGGYYLTRKVYTLCKTTLSDEWGMKVGDLWPIWTAYLVAYMVGQFVSSYVGRKWGPRILLLCGLGISICINMMFGFMNSLPGFVALMIVNGLAQSSGWPGVVGAVSMWIRPKDRGTIMGIWGTSYAVGNIAVKNLAPLLLALAGWRFAFWGCSLATLLIWGLILFWQRDEPKDVGLDSIVDKDGCERKGHAIDASQSDRISTMEYLRLVLNPVILAMGAGYFCIKFLRYALDSWLPAFLDIQGMGAAEAGFYSQIFDWAGLAGAIVAGFLLDKLFRGNWAILCFLMSIGMAFGYLAVVYFGSSPLAVALCFGVVGFMLYGPDTIMSGTACLEVAGEKNGVALAGVINGIGSIGPIVQEPVIGWLMRGDEMVGIRNTNRLALGMSITFAVIMAIMVWRLHYIHKAKKAASQ